MRGVGSAPKTSWREFNSQLRERPLAKESFEYLVTKGCPRDTLVGVLESVVAADTSLDTALPVALRRLDLTRKRIRTHVNHLLEVADLMEKIHRQDLLGKRYFGSFPHILRKAADVLNRWRPTHFIGSQWEAPLFVAHFVRLATREAHYKHVANLLEAAYAASHSRVTIEAGNLARTYARYRKVLSHPAYEQALHALLRREASSDM